jgi:RHS repeat-associated protein
MSDFFSSSFHNLTVTLDHVRDTYAKAGAQARIDIERRVASLSNQVQESVGHLKDVAMEVEAVRCFHAVELALERSEGRFFVLLKSEFESIDASVILRVVADVAKEVMIYVGGGAVIGAGLGALAGGVGAVPGALVGAELGAEVMAIVGLVSLGKAIVEAVPKLAEQAANGFATAWSAGKLPHDASAKRAALISSATESFAQCELFLFNVLLCAILAAVAGKVGNKLFQEIAKSKLGVRTAQWIEANRAKLAENPAVQKAIPAPKAAGGNGAKTPPAKQLPPPKPAKEEAPGVKPEKNGEGKGSCPLCVQLVGQPVNPLTGNKILAGDLDLDFSMPAPLPLVWQRVYSSGQPRAGWLGRGWWTPISGALKVRGDEVVVLDAFQREVTFSLPSIGESIYSPSEKITLVRTGTRTFELVEQDLKRSQFAIPETSSDTAHLVGIVDANGNAIRILYNRRQLPERIHDSAGRVFKLEFGEDRGQPRLLSIGILRDRDAQDSVLPAQKVDVLVQYAYDGAGDLVAVRNRAGQITRQYAYRNHILVEHGQPGGLVSRYEYDDYAASGKVLRNWTNNGLSWSFEYRHNETVVTDNLGRKQRYRFDEKQRYIGMVDAAGGASTRRLDKDGNVLSITDPAGRGTTYRYDGRSRIVRVESAGNGTGIVYDSRFDKPALVTDANGASTALRYDERGNLLSVTDALGQRTAYEYDGQGLPIKVTDARGGVKRLAYDSAAQLTSYTDCSGNVTRFSYDSEGRLTQATDANGNATSYKYDEIGHLLCVVQPDGAAQRYEYDSLGRLKSHIDAAGNRTGYVLDTDGKPLKRVDARGGVLEYRYDDARRMAELINENGDAYCFVYDALDRLAEETGFDARLTRYRYDDSGLLAAKEELGSGARSETTRIDTIYIRDRAGQLVEKTTSRITGDAGAEQLRLRYGYDRLGRMTRATNAEADIEMEYDRLGQLIEEKTHSDGNTTVLRHAYDELGNRIQTVLPDGRVLNNIFYGSGHLHQINIDGEIITDIERDATHRATSRSQGTLTTRLRYDPVGRLLSQVAGDGVTPVIARNYEYDGAGNLILIEDSRNGRTSYSYDAIGRILASVQPNLDERFAFDPAHNLIDTTVGACGRVEANRVRVFEDKRFNYDSHGNLVEKLVGRHTRMQFEWNGAHQMVKSTVTRNAQQDRPAEQSVKYFYDAFGRRIAKRDAFGTTRFSWDGNRLLCEMRGSDSRTYVYEPGSFVPLAQVGCTKQVRAVDRVPRVHYLHTDHLGTPREMTDPDGRVIWAATYKAWGNVLMLDQSEPQITTSALHHPFAEATAQAQPIRFQGQYHDLETGLHYNRFRYYDPDIGRFVSEDPVGLAGGVNTFAYAANPTGWTDPLGLTADCSCGSGGHFSKTEKPRATGATPNSIYTKTDKTGTVAVQNTVYDAQGNAIGQVDFKNHGGGAVSGHGHVLEPPGNLMGGHGPNAVHIEPTKVPPEWSAIPPGMKPSTPIGD